MEPDASTDPRTQRFPFAYDGSSGRLAKALGFGRGRAFVDVDDTTLVARFGPWVVETARNNVASVEVTGPYQAWRVVGPHVSLADRGLTFGTSTRRGACIRFHEPVRGAEPSGRLRHPGLTVTVERPEALAALLHVSAGAPPAM